MAQLHEMSRSRLLECLGGEWPAPAGLLELQVEAVETLPWGSRERLSLLSLPSADELSLRLLRL